MKKLMMIMAALAFAVAAQAETMAGKVYAQNTKGTDYWKIGKEAKDGKMSATANINKADYGKIALLNGKMVEVTGNLNPESKFPAFLPGIEIKVIEQVEAAE
jgi:hypothetical protein